MLIISNCLQNCKNEIFSIEKNSNNSYHFYIEQHKHNSQIL